MYKTKKKGGAMTQQAVVSIQNPSLLGSKMPSQPTSRSLPQNTGPLPQNKGLLPQNQQLIDIDGEKIKIIKTKKKPCKYGETLCKLKDLIEENENKLELGTEGDSFGHLINVPESASLIPENKSKKKYYKKKCLGGPEYNTLKKDTRQFFSLPSKENFKKFGGKYFIPNILGIPGITTENQYYSSRSGGRSGIMGMVKNIGSRFRMKGGSKNISKRKNKNKNNTNKTSKKKHKNMMGGMYQPQIQNMTSTPPNLKKLISGFGKVGNKSTNSGIHPLLIPKMVVGPNGQMMPTFKGTPLWNAVMRQGFEMESSTDDIFVYPSTKTKCCSKSKKLNYNLELGEKCLRNLQCKSKSCSSIRPLNIEGYCRPYELKNVVGKGGMCYKPSECKGSLQCIDGTCSTNPKPTQLYTYITGDSNYLSYDINLDGSGSGSGSGSGFSNPLNSLVDNKKFTIVPTTKNIKDTKCDLIREKFGKLKTFEQKEEFIQNKSPELNQCPFVLSPPCDLKNQKICSKLGKMVDHGMSNKKKNSFLKKYNCCQQDMVCTKAYNDSICLPLQQNIEKIQNLPNNVSCINNSQCMSGNCNPNTQTCKALLSKDRCDSLNPCNLSHDCVDGKCIIAEDIPDDMQHSSELCSKNSQCKSQKCAGNRSDLVTNALRKQVAEIPHEQISRLFADTHCFMNTLNKDDYMYNVCDANRELLQEYERIDVVLGKQLTGIYSIFKSSIYALNKSKPLPKVIFCNNFRYNEYDRSASFDVFDFTSQTAIVLVELDGVSRYVLAKMYYKLKNDYNIKGSKTKHSTPPDIASLEGDLYLFFIDPRSPGNLLKNLSKNIICMYTGNDLNRLPSGVSVATFIQIQPTSFNPSQKNEDILLVPNLCMYEYLVAQLFGEKIVCSPFKKLKWDLKGDKETFETLSRKSTRRGFYHYQINYSLYPETTITNMKKVEIDYGSHFGYNGAFDVPFTTQTRAVTDNNESISYNTYFVGTHELGVDKKLFAIGFKQWLQNITQKKYSAMDTSNNYLYRPHRGETFLLRYDTTKSSNQNIDKYTKERHPNTRNEYLIDIIGENITFKSLKPNKSSKKNSKPTTILYNIDFKKTNDMSLIEF